MKYGFIGCGNMGGAIAKAVSTRCADLAVTDRSGKAKNLGLPYTSAEDIARNADRIFLGVKPQALSLLAEQLTPFLEKRTDRFVLVSMAAGVDHFCLERMFGEYPIIRIMPNTPSAVGCGMVLYCPGAHAKEQDLPAFCKAMDVGCLTRLPEYKMDAASALAGCGPAFVYMFIEALADGGVKCGLSRQEALTFAAQTVLGGAEMVKSTGMHPGELKDAVCSPGGSTIAGVASLEHAAFRGAVIDAVCASYQRTKELT